MRVSSSSGLLVRSTAPLLSVSLLASASPQKKTPLEETYTPQFRKQFQAVFDEARRYLLRQKLMGKKGVVVLDVDDTVLDTRPRLAMPKEQRTDFYTWVKRAQAQVILEALGFIRWLERQKIPYYFVTGRRQHAEAATVQNLKNQGITGYAGIFHQPDTAPVDQTQAFKVQARGRIEKASGLPVLASIGDQDADVTGAHMKRGFKLPNPLYVIR